MPKPNFRYSHYDLKVLRAGAVIEVSLNAVNNIKLMTPQNFQRFTELLDYKFLGGIARKSPVRFTIPESGHWHLVVDSDGHAILAESAVKMIAAKSAQPTTQIASGIVAISPVTTSKDS